jgi:protease-4
MGDMAASGGYYISCAADSVISGKNTITGSIGVFFRSAYSNGFFEKLGISFDEVKTHEHADMFSITRPYTGEEIQYLQRSIDATYSTFLNRVSAGRNMSYNAVDAIAQGRVWSGTDALKVGLVDSYGGLNEAVLAAKKLAGDERTYSLVELPQQETTLEKLVKDLSGESKFESALNSMGFNKSTIAEVKQLLTLKGMVAVLPFTLSVE